MNIQLKRINERFHFEASNPQGNTVQIDGAPEHGGEGKGARPMELLLMGLAGCSGIDIGLILEKQRQTLDDFKVSIDAERETEVPKPFKHIHATFYLYGKIDPEKAQRAVELAMTKYCTVAVTLKKATTIDYSIVLNDQPL